MGLQQALLASDWGCRIGFHTIYFSVTQGCFNKADVLSRFFAVLPVGSVNIIPCHWQQHTGEPQAGDGTQAYITAVQPVGGEVDGAHTKLIGVVRVLAEGMSGLLREATYALDLRLPFTLYAYVLRMYGYAYRRIHIQTYIQTWVYTATSHS